MITREEIIKLANLSRIKLSEEEIAKMQGEMGSILAYVDTLKGATVKDQGPVMSVNKNVLRADTDAHESGIFTKKLINLSPRKDGDFVKVKKILGSSQ